MSERVGSAGNVAMLNVNIAEMGIDPSIVNQDPEIMGGEPVFPDTRVLVRFMLNYLKTNRPLHMFLSHYLSVTKEKAVSVLELAFERTIGLDDENDTVR